jgi:hypothetical protein
MRLALGGVLFLAGALKLGRDSEFEPTARALGLSHTLLLAVTLQLLPVVELCLGLGLLLGLWTVPVLTATGLLLAAFTLVLLTLMRHGYEGGCACFGVVDRHPVGWVHIGRNALLLLASAFVLVQALTGRCASSAFWDLPPSVVLTATALLAVSALAYALAAEVEFFFVRVAGR